MTLRRYLLVRTGWAAGMLFAFVSIAYLVVWVAGDLPHGPGYGSFLWERTHRLPWRGGPATSVDRERERELARLACLGSDALAAARDGGVHRGARRPARAACQAGALVQSGRQRLRVPRRVAAANLDRALHRLLPRAQGRPAPHRRLLPAHLGTGRPLPRPGRVAGAPGLAGAHADALLRRGLHPNRAARPRAGRARAPSQSGGGRGRRARAPGRQALLHLCLSEAIRSRPGVRARLCVLRRDHLSAAGADPDDPDRQLLGGGAGDRRRARRRDADRRGHEPVR